MAERVGGVVGGQAIVVERHGTATTDDPQQARRLEAQPDVTADVSLGLGDERVQRLLERREPHAVIDQLGPARLEAALLVGDVALEYEVFEVSVRRD